MRRYVPRTYNNRRWVRVVLRITLIVTLSAAIIFVSLFFGLKKYIVYGPEGLRLEIPILAEE